MQLSSSAETELGPIYRLADQLDGALALAEDLSKLTVDIARLAPGDANGAIEGRHAAIAGFARRARALELTLVARLIQARQRAAEARARHPRFEPLLALFVGGTAAFADVVGGRNGGLGDVSAMALATGTDVEQFLLARGVFAASANAGVPATIAVTETYPVGGVIPLGTVMDMVAQLLDSLDLAFDLYAEPRAVTTPEPAAASA